MSKVITIIALALIAYYWGYTQKLKQLAVRASRKRCNEAGVQFLDHTVVQNKFTIAKDDQNRWQLQREYLFDFTSTGEQRYQGQVIIQGRKVSSIELQAYNIN